MSRIGDKLSQKSAGNLLFTEEEFKLAVWSAFSDDQKDCLVWDQNMDPYDADNPFDAEAFCKPTRGDITLNLHPFL